MPIQFIPMAFSMDLLVLLEKKSTILDVLPALLDPTQDWEIQFAFHAHRFLSSRSTRIQTEVNSSISAIRSKIRPKLTTG